MAGLPKYLWIKNRRLYLYQKFKSKANAYKLAKYYQKKLRNNYYILVGEDFWGERIYGLYMNKIISFVN